MFLNVSVWDLCIRPATAVTYFVFRKKNSKKYIQYDDVYAWL